MKWILAPAILGVLLLALAGPAASAIKISKIYYDAPGSDYGSNVSLNNEWIRVANTGSRAKQLRGWRIRDGAGHAYQFGSLRLRAGRTVTLHTGPGLDGRRHVFWGSGWYIWNNDADRATLRKPSGRTADSCSYSGSNAVAYC